MDSFSACGWSQWKSTLRFRIPLVRLELLITNNLSRIGIVQTVVKLSTVIAKYLCAWSEKNVQEDGSDFHHEHKEAQRNENNI